MGKECSTEHNFPAESYQENHISWHRSPADAVFSALVPCTPTYNFPFCIEELKYNKMEIVFYAVFIPALRLCWLKRCIV